MVNRERYRELLERVHKAHQEHRRSYLNARSTYGTNKKAHEATAQQLEEFRAALRSLVAIIEPVENAFFSGNRAAVDEIISFIEVDVPAFNSGYRKERYYRRLKQLKLTDDQVERLRSVALQRCASSEHRREDNELRRLMIRLADSTFLKRLLTLPDNLNPYVRRKKALMLEVVLRGRKDLREKVRQETASPHS